MLRCFRDQFLSKRAPPSTQAMSEPPPHATVSVCKSFVTYKGNASLLLSTGVFEGLQLVAVEPTVQTTPIDDFPFPVYALHLPNFKKVADEWARVQTRRVNFSAFLFRILDTSATATDGLRILNFLPSGDALQFVSEIRQMEGKSSYLDNLPELCEEDINLKIHSLTMHFAQRLNTIPFCFTGVSVFDAGTIRLPKTLSDRTAREFVTELGKRSDRCCLEQSKVCFTETSVFRRHPHIHVCNWTGKRKNTTMQILHQDAK
jgi:hypothetical protein